MNEKERKKKADEMFRRARRLTPRQLVNFQKRVLLEYTPAHLQAAMESLLRLARDGDMAAVKLILQMHNLVAAPGGITVTTNIQNNLDGGTSAHGWSFDSAIRALDDRERDAQARKALPGAPKVIEAHPLDLVEQGEGNAVVKAEG